MKNHLYGIIEELRYIRIKNGITMMELRDKSGVSQKHISEIENHKTTPTIETLNKLAKGMGVDLKVQVLKGDNHDQDRTNGKTNSRTGI